MHIFTGTVLVKLDFAQGVVQDLWKMKALQESVSAQVVNETFGELLSAARRRSRYSQTELGRRVGLSRGTVSNIEAGVQNVQLHQVYAFCLALDKPISELLPRLGDVITAEDRSLQQDRAFLEFAKRQLIDISGDDDANT